MSFLMDPLQREKNSLSIFKKQAIYFFMIQQNEGCAACNNHKKVEFLYKSVSNRDKVALQGYADVGLDAGAFLPATSGHPFKAQQRRGQRTGTRQHVVYRHVF